MAQYRVKDPAGQEHIIDGPEGATPDEVMAQAQKLISSGQSQSQPDTSMLDVAKYAAQAPFTQPYEAVKFGAQNPEKLPSQLPAMGAVAGELLAGPPGAAIGAGLGQIGKRIGDIGLGNTQPGDAMNPAKEAVTPMIQSAIAGIPGVSGFLQPGKQTVAQSAIKGLAKAGQTLSGAKKDVLEQAVKQGYSTYAAPSLPKAQEIFGQALGPEGQAALKQSATEVFDPALGKARSIATEIGTKLENGDPITAIEALKARQATDRVISATSITDKSARQALFDWRTKFDDIITNQNGPLAKASDLYRKAIVKDQLLSPTRLNKSGEPSAFLPMIVGHGMMGKGIESGLGVLTGTSPAVWGAGATSLGAITPEMRQAALASFIDRVTTKETP